MDHHIMPTRQQSVAQNTGAVYSTWEPLDDDEDQFGPPNLAGASASISSGGSDPAATLAPSDELRELCYLQLTMLIRSLEAHLGAAVADTAVRCAVYRRSAASLPSGQLQLQLVAASDARTADAPSPRQDLILGIPEANEHAQEAWIVEQNLIVLPDSGGLVLPLSHNSFLVGLLVVECCAEDASTIGNVAGTLHPPACAVFSPGDMALIKQTGSALALACAMDLCAALERAGHAVRRSQVQGLVRQARKPLRTLRTLGKMLVPRLQEGEPERDMTDNIVVQGERLGDIVAQLQTFLAPPMPSVRIGAPPSQQQQQQASRTAIGNFDSYTTTSTTSAGSGPSSSSSSSSSAVTTSSALGNMPITTTSPRPALPSSSIGGDFWDPAPPPRRFPGDDKSTTSSMSSVSIDSVDVSPGEVLSGGDTNGVPSAAGTAEVLQGPVTPLIPVLTPLLQSAENFASVSGVTYLFAGQNEEQQQAGGEGSVFSGSFQQQSRPGGGGGGRRSSSGIAFPETTVSVDALVLKRMLSQLLDGAIACAARGDCIEFLIEKEVSPQGRPGVVVATRLLQAIGPGTLTRFTATALDADGHVFIAEFATLARLARQAGGWFDVKVEGLLPSSSANYALGSGSSSSSLSSMETLDLIDENNSGGGGSSGTLMAALWLPIAPSAS